MRGGRIFLGIIVSASLGLAGAASAESVNALRARATQLYRVGSFGEALPLFDEVLRRHPRDIEAYTKRGNIYLRLDQPQSALADFDEAVRLNPTWLPLSSFTLGDLPVSQSPQYPPPRASRGIALLMLGRPDEAIEAFHQAIVNYDRGGWPPKYKAGAYTGLGDAYHVLGQEEPALKAYDQALRYDSQNAIAYLGRGSVHAASGRYDQALADLSEGIRLDDQAIVDRGESPSRPPRSESSHSRAYDTRGSALARLGRNEEAVADFDTAIRFDPTFAAAYNHRAAVLVGLGRFDLALKDLDQSIRLDPKRASAYQNRAAAHNGLGQFDAALDDGEKALRLNPDAVGAYNNRGLAYFGLGLHDRALRDFDEVIRRAPRLASAHVTRGNALFRIGHPERAIQDFDEALRMDPRLAGAYVGLGLALDALGRFGEAIRSYDLAIGLDPRHADAYFDRGSSRRTLGDWEGALADFDETLRLSPRRADAYLVRGWARFLIGREGADADARAYLDLRGMRDRAAPTTAILGSLAARRSGREAEARSFLERATAGMDPNAWPYPIVAYLMRAITARILLEAADEPTRATEAHLFIGLDRLLDGDGAGALEHLRWVRDRGQPGSAARDIGRVLLPPLDAAPPAPPQP